MRRVRMTAEERRAQLLEKAAIEFAQRGYHAAGTADIARATGIAEPTIYRHFASKEELFSEVAGAAAASLAERIREVVPRDLAALEALLREEAASAPRLALVARLLHEGRDPAMRRVAQEALLSLEEALAGLGEEAHLGRAMVLAAGLLSAAGLYVSNERWTQAA